MPKVKGKRVTEIRVAKGWSREDLARKTGLSERAIDRVENDEGAVRLETIKLLAVTLGVNHTVLLIRESIAPITASGALEPEEFASVTIDHTDTNKALVFVDILSSHPFATWSAAVERTVSKAIESALDRKQPIQVLFRVPGSTIFRIQLPEIEAETLVAIIRNGQLAEESLLEAVIIYDPNRSTIGSEVRDRWIKAGLRHSMREGLGDSISPIELASSIDKALSHENI